MRVVLRKWTPRAAARAKQLYILSHKASMNKNVSGFFVILIACLDIGI